jgi:hypothetical protein
VPRRGPAALAHFTAVVEQLAEFIETPSKHDCPDGVSFYQIRLKSKKYNQTAIQTNYPKENQMVHHVFIGKNFREKAIVRL